MTDIARHPTPDFIAAWVTCARRARAPLSDEAMRQARRSWFDTIATALGGMHERCTHAAVEASGGADPALVLGTAAHALDYDDVCMLATCHPSAPVVSALLAVLPQADARLAFADVLGAYLLGVETALRLGQWIGFRHYALGFHATDTLGVVGAAAACAQLLELPDDVARRAMAIAASSAGGLRANFGTDTKPLHCGLAASAAVRAVLLARAGATASDEVWGARGFAYAFSGGEQPQRLAWTGSQPWAIEQPGFEHKRFPSCYLTHRMIAGVLKLRQGAPALPMPDRVEIGLPAHGLAALIHPRPVTGLEGKFSAEYCCAAAWHDGAVTLRSFSDAAPLRVEVQALMARVVTTEREAAGEKLDTAPVHVRVLHASGDSSAVTVDWAPGSMADPMSRADLLAKWDDCAAHAGHPAGDNRAALALLDAPAGTRASDVLGPLRALLLG
ncbi:MULTISPECIES: MmgE/PrpD family protein [unclassified Variovorax]|uniref:MmgE/PrpD family protein n=1 Tax=unclassified Variovorax TaxID=663243 RepID=UPI0008BFB5FA|nr:MULTISPECIES: MmgE/PrpD family protein [unclassified Variovorax]SEK17273.1 2-methylcitrate dehydratase PrpD [Variovorax sp. OK202]SFE77166.1 2-methylcitrate dehydratase PrpD [Variovorax sp. OK212]